MKKRQMLIALTALAISGGIMFAPTTVHASESGEQSEGASNPGGEQGESGEGQGEAGGQSSEGEGQGEAGTQGSEGEGQGEAGGQGLEGEGGQGEAGSQGLEGEGVQGEAGTQAITGEEGAVPAQPQVGENVGEENITQEQPAVLGVRRTMNVPDNSGAVAMQSAPPALMSVAPANNTQNVTYDNDATRVNEYTGVFATEQLQPNTATKEEAAASHTIGISEIADANLPDTPTEESPAIIQGAAVGYEVKTGATSYDEIQSREGTPYADYKYKIIDEVGPDGTVHKKMSGFDQTYVIIRVDVSAFLPSNSSQNVYLHIRQDNNRALMPAATMDPDGNGTEYTIAEEAAKGGNSFTDGLGNRTSSYNINYLTNKNAVDAQGHVYVDLVLFATSSIVAGADAGKADAPNGDVPLAIYVDNILDYEPTFEPDPTYQAPTTEEATAYTNRCLGKFFDETKATLTTISRYLIKGSDLKLETMVKDSGGANKDTGTTFWSLQKSFEHEYYDLPADTSKDDPGCGRTVTLMSEVAIVDSLDIIGTSEDQLKKRTLDVNSFDVQIANNTSAGGGYSDGFTLRNGWLTILDKSNTTGSEVAIGNNARFVIDAGGKLVIDKSCQLEIEWDGATVAPNPDGTMPENPDTLNNGTLDLRAGGTLENRGVISIEGTEGKPAAAGEAADIAKKSEKGFGEMTINPGATITNYGCMLVNGKLYNLGTLINYGRYADKITSNDPDKGLFEYPMGIVVAWKDDVTQDNIYPGSIINGKDRNGNLYPDAILINNGDIVMTPGEINNYSLLRNEASTFIYLGTDVDAIIPIEPDPLDTRVPPVTQKRITLNPPRGSFINNYGTIYNAGTIITASVELRDNISFGAITAPGRFGMYSGINNYGEIINEGTIILYEAPIDANAGVPAVGSSVIYNPPYEPGVTPIKPIQIVKGGSAVVLGNDGSFAIILENYNKIEGEYKNVDGQIAFILADGTVLLPTSVDEYGNVIYTVTLADGTVVTFKLSSAYIKWLLKYYAVLKYSFNEFGQIVRIYQ